MPGPAWEYMLLGAICGKTVLCPIGGPAAEAIGGGACIPKAKGSVMGWLVDWGPIIAAGTVDVCLRGLVLRKALGPAPAEGGPEAPGGSFRGGGCIVAGVTNAQTKPLVMSLRILNSGVAGDEIKTQSMNECTKRRNRRRW